MVANPGSINSSQPEEDSRHLEPHKNFSPADPIFTVRTDESHRENGQTLRVGGSDPSVVFSWCLLLHLVFVS